jgi:hypothetical protein
MTASQDGQIVGMILPDHDFVLIEAAAIKEIEAQPSRKPRARRDGPD